MSKLRVLDLFSGAGMFSLGLERTGGFKTAAFCEINPDARHVLASHWPGVPCYDDVRTLSADRLTADGISVDVICGGFPCQDLSIANVTGEGLGGARSGLWSEYCRLIGELRPHFVIVENVAALLAGPTEQPGQWFGRVLGGLAGHGYDAEWRVLRAFDAGLPHIRERVWIAAYPGGTGREGCFEYFHAPVFTAQASAISRDEAVRAWPALERDFRSIRAIDGVSVSMERRRLHLCGNAVPPQFPELIGRAILAARAAA